MVIIIATKLSLQQVHERTATNDGGKHKENELKREKNWLT